MMYVDVCGCAMLYVIEGVVGYGIKVRCVD